MITSLIKNVIFLLPRDLWLTNLTEWCVLMRAYYPQSHIKSRKKWNTIKHHFHVTCGYQTWQKGGLWLGVTCLTKSQPSDYAFTWAHVTNELHCMFTLRSLLPLNLAGWWLVKLKSWRRFNYFCFFVFLANFDSIEKISPVKILYS